MKAHIHSWLVSAHNRWPLPFKSFARGAISGSIGCFLLSLGYTAVLSVFFLTVIAPIGEALSENLPSSPSSFLENAVLFWPLLRVFVLGSARTSIELGLICGGLTGVGMYFARRTTHVSSFWAVALSLIVWLMVVYGVAPSIFGSDILGAGSVISPIPPLVFVLAMAYAAKRSLNPFIKVPVGM